MYEGLGWSDVRPCVRAFAVEMEKKLRANAHKGDRDTWRSTDLEILVTRIEEEAEELYDAICDDGVTDPETGRALAKGGPTRSAEAVRRVAMEAADVGNFAMMIADACGGLAVDDDDD